MLPTDIKNPCKAVAKWIEAINRGEEISRHDLGNLRVHLTIFPECMKLVNEQGIRILGGRRDRS
jgi:hypothetical protein